MQNKTLEKLREELRAAQAAYHAALMERFKQLQHVQDKNPLHF